MPIIFNPGTEGRTDSSLMNAEIVAGMIADDLKIARETVQRAPKLDVPGGFFGFALIADGMTVELHIPGDDPEEVRAGVPFVSRRLYVDGSSYWYGFALNIIESRMEEGGER